MLRGMKGTIQSLAALSLVSLLAACGTTRSVVVQRSSQPRTATYATSSRYQGQSRATRYRVAKGDTLYSIAFRHGVDFRDVARWNDIAAPYTIWPGQQLVLRAPSSSRPVTARSVARVAPSPRALPPPAPSPASVHSAVVADDVPVAGVPASMPAPPPPAPATAAPGGTRSAGGVNWRWPA